MSMDSTDFIMFSRKLESIVEELRILNDTLKQMLELCKDVKQKGDERLAKK